MMSTSNILINEELLGYVPSEKDPNRVCDYKFNLQIHFPHKYDVDKVKQCANAIRGIVTKTKGFDAVSVTTVRHKPHCGSYFHHISTNEVVGKSIWEITLYTLLYINSNIKLIPR